MKYIYKQEAGLQHSAQTDICTYRFPCQIIPLTQTQQGKVSETAYVSAEIQAAALRACYEKEQYST